MPPSIGHRGELLGVDDRRLVLNGQTLVRGLDEATGARSRGFEVGQRRDPQRVAGGLDDLVEADVVFGERRRVDLDLELTLPLAEDRDVRHAVDAEEVRSQRPPSEHAQLDRG